MGTDDRNIKAGNMGVSSRSNHIHSDPHDRTQAGDGTADLVFERQRNNSSPAGDSDTNVVLEGQHENANQAGDGLGKEDFCNAEAFALYQALERYRAARPLVDSREASSLQGIQRWLQTLPAQALPTSEFSQSTHFTSSCFIVSQTSNKLVLHLHKRLNYWIQPGGHIDKGENFLQAALREATEETGLPIVAARPTNKNDNTDTVSGLLVHGNAQLQNGNKRSSATLSSPGDTQVKNGNTSPVNHSELLSHGDAEIEYGSTNNTEGLLVHVDAHNSAKGHRHYDLRFIFVCDEVPPAPAEGESQDVEWLTIDEARVKGLEEFHPLFNKLEDIMATFTPQQDRSKNPLAPTQTQQDRSKNPLAPTQTQQDRSKNSLAPTQTQHKQPNNLDSNTLLSQEIAPEKHLLHAFLSLGVPWKL